MTLSSSTQSYLQLATTRMFAFNDATHRFLRATLQATSPCTVHSFAFHKASQEKLDQQPCRFEEYNQLIQKDPEKKKSARRDALRNLAQSHLRNLCTLFVSRTENHTKKMMIEKHAAFCKQSPSSLLRICVSGRKFQALLRGLHHNGW